MNKYALIIGNSQYDNPTLRKLQAPDVDVRALAEVLSNPEIGGFSTQTMINALSSRVAQEIEAFFVERKTDDLLLLYFSGHGVKDESGQLYFAVSDTNPNRLRSTAIPAQLVKDVMRLSRSRRQVLLLDCCFSGAFAKGLLTKSDKRIYAPSLFGGRGRYILTASDALQYAFQGEQIEGKDTTSVFTSILVEGLKTGTADLNDDGIITFEELADFVCDRVAEEKPEQTPQKTLLETTGNIVIAKSIGFAERKAREKAEREDAERLARERAERDSAEKAALEKAQREIAEKAAREKAEREAVEKAAREKAEREAIERAVRKTVEGEIAEKAAREKGEREAAEKAIGDKAEHNAVKQKDPETLIPSPPDEQKVPKKSHRKLKTEYIIAIIGAAATILAVLIGIAPQIIRLVPVPTATITVTRPVISAPTATFTVVSQSKTPNPSRTPTKTQTPIPTVILPALYTDEKGVSMVLVPAGEFTMGNDIGNGDPFEIPVHKVNLNAFYIDKYEVTNGHYKDCVDAGMCQVPKQRSSMKMPSYYENAKFKDYPVNWVDWNMAKTYCGWRGARLPTEAEWEKAARGIDGREFPWQKVGVIIDKTYANYGNLVGDFTTVGSYEKGKSPYGAYDMAGNVFEWVADWFSWDYYSISPYQNPLGPETGDYHVFRGGGVGSDPAFVRTSSRQWFDTSSSSGAITLGIGIRCARDVQP